MATRYLTLSDAARRLDCSTTWAAHLFDAGALAGMRDGSGRRLVTEGSVEHLRQRREARRARTRDASAGAAVVAEAT